MRLSKTAVAERETAVKDLLTKNPDLTIAQVNEHFKTNGQKTMAAKRIQELRRSLSPATVTVGTEVVQTPSAPAPVTETVVAEATPVAEPAATVTEAPTDVVTVTVAEEATPTQTVTISLDQAIMFGAQPQS